MRLSLALGGPRAGEGPRRAERSPTAVSCLLSLCRSPAPWKAVMGTVTELAHDTHTGTHQPAAGGMPRPDGTARARPPQLRILRAVSF